VNRNIKDSDVERVFQQGDVLFIKLKDPIEEEELNALPKVGRRAGDGRFIVAEGEATGHHHAITEEVDMRDIDADNSEFVITAEEPFMLGHEEHSMKSKVARAGSVDNLSKADQDYITEILKEDLDQPFDQLVAKVPDAMKLPEGTYVTRIVREHDHENERSRRVWD